MKNPRGGFYIYIKHTNVPYAILDNSLPSRKEGKLLSAENRKNGCKGYIARPSVRFLPRGCVSEKMYPSPRNPPRHHPPAITAPNESISHGTEEGGKERNITRCYMKCVLLYPPFEYNPVIFGTFRNYCTESGKRLSDEMISERRERKGETKGKTGKGVYI